MDSAMALGLTEQALFCKVEVYTLSYFCALNLLKVSIPNGGVELFQFPMRITVDKLKVEDSLTKFSADFFEGRNLQ